MTRWSLSTAHGASLTADELVGVLASQHDRIVATWGSLAPAQWGEASRNAAWTVHETARHMADVMVAMTAQTCDDPWPFEEVPFDPNSTPDLWLARSADESPAQTLERFAAEAPRFRDTIGRRVEAGDSGTAGTPYGSAHWTMSIVHTFWDTWLHERDIAIPLGMEAPSTSPEHRLVALYALLMAVVPTLRMDLEFETSVRFTGPVDMAATAAHSDGTITSHESAPTDGAPSGDLAMAVDALSGRGAEVAEALPGSPELLAMLAGFLRS